MTGSKRRRHTRFEINQAATVVVDRLGISLRCMIRDFCSGGLFIELQRGVSTSTLQQHQIVDVRFVANTEQGEKTFNQSAKVMHINSIGIGVAFEQDSKAVFNALIGIAQQAKGMDVKDRFTSRETLEQQQKLETEIRLLLKETYPRILNHFIKLVGKKQKEAVEKGGHFHYQTLLADVQTNLKINKESVRNSFCRVTESDVRLLIPDTDFEQIDETRADSQLSLIDKNDFEDWLNLSTIIRNLDARFELPLNSMLEKMAHVLGVDKHLIFNPFCPAKLCDRFRDTLTEIENDDHKKRCLYIIYEETLISELEQLYQQIDQILVNQGAAEDSNGGHFQRSFKKISPSLKPHTEFRRESEETIDEEESQTQNNESHSIKGEWLPAKVADQPSTIPESSKNVSVANNLVQLLQENHNALVRPANLQASEEVSLSEYSAEEIQGALQNVHQHLSSHQNISTELNIPQAFVKALVKLGGVSKQLSVNDKNNLEIYELLFSILLNDNLSTLESQGYLQKIRMPILSLVIQDRDFLESENHPARNIVNHLFWLGSAIKGDTSKKGLQIRQSLDKLVERVSLESLQNPEIYSQVENQLAEITHEIHKSVDQNIKRITESYAGQQKLSNAREFVQDQFQQYFSSSAIPKILHSLIEAGWQHLLVMDKLNEDNDAYRNHLAILINLYSWLTGSKRYSRGVARRVLEIVDKELQPVCSNTFVHGKVLRELSSLLLKNKIQPGSDAMKIIRFNTDDSIQADENHTRLDEIDFLKVGDWFLMIVDQKFEPLKLIWVSTKQDTFVFVNRIGVKQQELGRLTLYELINNGSAIKIDSLDEPVMDRATNMLLQNLQQKIVQNATRDQVTNLINRKEFIKQLKLQLANLDNSKYLLCNIEVQDFRIITNACGLAGRDALLKQVATQITVALKQEDLSARLDDRTFCVFLKNCTADIVKKLQTNLISNEFKWQEKSYAVAVSIGIVPLFSNHRYELDRVLQQVDLATLAAKQAGRNKIRVYQDDESFKSQYNANEWVGKINQVFAQNRLFLRCQKIAALDAKKDEHTHYEILLGIKDEEGNVIAPDNFIPAVERCRRMSEVDKWVVTNVFDWIENHLEIFNQLDGFSINLSGESMNSEEFLQFLIELLTESNVPLDKITFEITETVAANSFEFIQAFIKKVKRFRCKFSIDDFGSGYSSYSYLKSLDADYLKIDGIFVKDIVNSKTDVVIVKSMNEIGHSLNMKTIAEYVENEDIRDVLKEMGVDYAQGWGIQKPILIEQLEADYSNNELKSMSEVELKTSI